MATIHEDCSFQKLCQEWENQKKKRPRSESLYQWCRDELFAGRLADACRSHIRNSVWCDYGDRLLNMWDRDGSEETALASLVNSSRFNLNKHQLRMAWAHLAITRHVVEENLSLEGALQWTSGTFLEDVVDEATGGLWDASPFGPAFFQSLVRFLAPTPGLSNDQRSVTGDGHSASMLFPVVIKSGADSEGEAVVARFLLQRQDRGTGSTYLHPSQAFLDMDEEFRGTFARAQQLVEDLAFNVCVRVEPWNEEQSFAGQTLAGPSAGGALYLGLRSLAEEKSLEGGLVTSLALTETQEAPPDGRCHPVGFIRTKGSKLPQEGFRRFLVAKHQDAGGLKKHTPGLEILRARTVEEAWEHATGRLAELRRYLRHVKEEAKEAAQFMSRDMPRVRARVRVSSERLPYDQIDRSEEQALLGSLENREKLYEHRMGRSGSMERDDGPGRGGGEQEKTYETLDWDKDIVGSGLKRGVILGDPGMGKTWLLHWEARRLAQEALDQLDRSARPDEVQIPVRLRLFNVAKILCDTGCSFQEAVVESFSQKWIRHPSQPADHPSELLTGLIEEKIGGEGAWLLLDALDEVLGDEGDECGYRDADNRRSAVVGGLKSFIRNNPGSHFLVTSRTTRYDGAFSDIIRQDETEREMELLPFEDEQIREFARGYFGEEDAEEFLDELDDSAQIRGMAEVPLLLTFLCKIYESREGSGFQSVNRAQVYEQILDKILSATWHETERTSIRHKEGLKNELSALAFTLLIQGELQFGGSRLREATKFAMAPTPPTRSNVDERLDEYTGKPGVLTSVGSEKGKGPYLFVHLTIQEYLAARWIAKQANEDGWDAEIETGDGRSFKISTIVDHKAWSPHWQQVILLLAGQLDDPVPLLELLADEERDDIFRNRLALAAHCLGEVMPKHS